jgi:hypothetical protein
MILTTADKLLMDLAEQVEFLRTTSLYSMSGYKYNTLHILNSLLTKLKIYTDIILH